MFIEETSTIATGLALWKNPENEVCLTLIGLDGRPFQNHMGYDTVCYGPAYGHQFNHTFGLLADVFSAWDFSQGFRGRIEVYVRDHTFGKGNDGFAVPVALRVQRASGSISSMPVTPVALIQ